MKEQPEKLNIKDYKIDKILNIEIYLDDKLIDGWDMTDEHVCSIEEAE